MITAPVVPNPLKSGRLLHFFWQLHIKKRFTRNIQETLKRLHLASLEKKCILQLMQWLPDG